MKRLVLLAAVVAGAVGFGAAPRVLAAAPGTNQAASTTNDLLSLIPGFSGGDTRHICLIFDQLDTSYCVYIPLP